MDVIKACLDVGMQTAVVILWFFFSLKVGLIKPYVLVLFMAKDLRPPTWDASKFSGYLNLESRNSLDVDLGEHVGKLNVFSFSHQICVVLIWLCVTLAKFPHNVSVTTDRKILYLIHYIQIKCVDLI